MREVPQAVYADLIGVPFVLNARGPEAYDCFGLALEVLRRLGTAIPDNESPEQYAMHAAWAAVESQRWEPCPQQPGAAVMFQLPVKDAQGVKQLAVVHCGVVLSATEFIHSWECTGGVTTERLHEWTRRIAGFYCFKG